MQIYQSEGFCEGGGFVMTFGIVKIEGTSNKRWRRCRIKMAAPTEGITDEKSIVHTAALHPAESRIDIYNFSATLLSTQVQFHVMKMEDGFFLWIGNKENFDNLAAAMKTKFVSFGAD